MSPSVIPMHPCRRLAPAALALFMGLAGCASADLISENRVALQAAHEQLQTGDGAAACRQLEALVVRTNAAPSDFVLQRFFAVYLMSRAQFEASFVGSGDDWLEGVAACAYYMNFALDWSRAAKAAAPKGEAGQDVLPADLAAFGVDNAQTFLDMAWLVSCARTKFQGEVADVLARQTQLGSVAQAEALCSSVGLSENLRPWLLWSVFDYQKSHNEQLAYTFGIRARELGRQVPKAFPPERCQQIVQWILGESKLLFKSSAGVEFDPGAEVCSQTGEPNLSFQGHPK